MIDTTRQTDALESYAELLHDDLIDELLTDDEIEGMQQTARLNGIGRDPWAWDDDGSFERDLRRYHGC